jgi:hypothetical protein
MTAAFASALRAHQPKLRNYSGRADRSVEGTAQNLEFRNLAMNLFGELNGSR